MRSPSSPMLMIVLLVVSAVVAAAYAEQPSLKDYLPEDGRSRDWDDPVIDGLDDGFRSSTDVDHAVVRGKLEELVARVTAWREEHGGLPERLDVLVPGGDMEGGRAIVPDGMWRVPTDPWGNAYVYEVLEEGGFVVRSLGPDGLSDTLDDVVQTESGDDTDDG